MAGAISFLQLSSSTADLSSYTFSGVNIGSAASDRYIAVGAMSRAVGTSFAISSVTIGGNSATQIANATNSVTNSTAAGIWLLAVPSGTSADIVVNLSTGGLRCAIATYRITGISPTPSDTGTSTASPGSTALDIPADGVALACSATGNSGFTATWSNLTENADTLVEAFTVTSASAAFASEQVGLSTSVTWSSTPNEPVAAFAAFGPAAAGLSIPVAFNHYQKLRRA